MILKLWCYFKMNEVNKINQWFGESELRHNFARIKSFWQGQERFLVTINSAHEMYRQLNDENEMVSKAVLNIEDQAKLPGVNFPVFHADFGTICAPKHWGGETFLDSTGERLNIKPVAKNAHEAVGLEVLPVDRPGMDGPRSISLYRKLCQELGSDDIWLRMPDPQGPFTIAGLIVNQEELLMDLYANPDDVHKLLEKTTDLYIDFIRYCQKETNGKMFGSVWPYMYFTPEDGTWIVEDLMPLLSTEIYAEFAVPYLNKVSKELGDLHIHCCGKWGHHAETIANVDAKVKSVEFHYPFTKVEELSCLVDQGVVLVPFILLDNQDDFSSLSEYYEFLLEKTEANTRFWFTFLEANDEALEFANKHGF